MKFQALTTLAVALSGLASATPSAVDMPEDENSLARLACNWDVAKKLVFDYRIDQFNAARAKHKPSSCDWSSDGCSWSEDKPNGYNFLPACRRHDFGYRNLKMRINGKVYRIPESLRKQVDDNFRQDMKDVCLKQGKNQAACLECESCYYQVVRACGNGFGKSCIKKVVTSKACFGCQL